MMKPVDNLMLKCPLKHEIRVAFWEPFIRKLRKAEISYLTLYSPPLMDVKYLYKRNLIKVENGFYKNVVGVGIDADSEAKSTSEVDYRLDLLLGGDINDLLNDSAEKTEKKKQLASKFPFDVINLDYVDTLHKKGLNVDISPHINAIETILSRQHKLNKDKFVLFLTTCVNIEHYNKKGLLDPISKKFDENVAETIGFLEKLQKLCNCSSSNEYAKKNPNNYFALALSKFLLGHIGDYAFTVKLADIKWLVRDAYESPIEKYLLHLAFYIERYTPDKAKSTKSIGRRQNNVEQYSVNLIKSDYDTLRVSEKWDALTQKYGSQIDDIFNMTFENPIPPIIK